MPTLTNKTRLPIEAAIEFVEDSLGEADRIFRSDLQRRCQEQAPDAASMLDHTIQVMIHNGYLRRFSEGPGMMGYEKTPHWVNRNETLILLRAPVYKKRIRPRRKIPVDQPAQIAATKKMLALGTVNAGVKMLSGLKRQATQLELFAP